MKLDLPPHQFRPPGIHFNDYYGASRAAAAYCGYDLPPYCGKGMWVHGWSWRRRNVHPLSIIHLPGYECPDECHWVARKDQEVFLHEHGYKGALAIGMPIVYLPRLEIERLPKSLLVMPAHSLPSQSQQWDDSLYARELEKIAGDFDYKCACVHWADMQKGVWRKPLEALGFEVVQGGLANDLATLERMRYLFSRFEYMTTNQIGSHVAYAAYFGVKVFFYGTYINGDFRAHPPHVEVCGEEVAMKHERMTSEELVREEFPFLFCPHQEAREQREWAAHELGEAHRKTPDELIDLFEWPRCLLHPLSAGRVGHATEVTYQYDRLPHRALGLLADRGDLDALITLGRYFFRGRIDVPAYPKYGFKCLMMAARCGSPRAQYQIAMILLAKQDREHHADAAKLLEAAASSGHEEAMRVLAVAFRDGSFVGRDVGRSLFWLDMLANKGAGVGL